MVSIKNASGIDTGDSDVVGNIQFIRSGLISIGKGGWINLQLNIYRVCSTLDAPILLDSFFEELTLIAQIIRRYDVEHYISKRKCTIAHSCLFRIRNKTIFYTLYWQHYSCCWIIRILYRVIHATGTKYTFTHYIR
ncbi:hypothetical protein D3C77_535710 [compost metagenome]